MENTDLANSLEFFAEPFEIAPENRLTAFRYNINGYSPFQTANKWDYGSKSVKTSNGYGIYGMSMKEHCLGHAISILHENVINNENREIDIVMLELDKGDILYINDMEFAFTKCNIICKLSIDDFIVRFFPVYFNFIVSYRCVKAFPNDTNKNIFIQHHRKAYGIATCSISSVYKEPKSLDYYLNLNCVKNFAQKQFKLTDIHGMSHWVRVEMNGIILSKETNANLTIVRLFAYVHDMCKLIPGHDPDHGLRAAMLIDKYSVSLFCGISSEDLELLKFACTHHTRMIKSGDPTIDTCFDADRLDLPRVGITPDPNLMATNIGAMYAASLRRL